MQSVYSTAPADWVGVLRGLIVLHLWLISLSASSFTAFFFISLARSTYSYSFCFPLFLLCSQRLLSLKDDYCFCTLCGVMVNEWPTYPLQRWSPPADTIVSSLSLYSLRLFHVSFNRWFFHKSPSDKKSSQTFRTLLNILADFNSAVVWIVTIFLLIIRSLNFFSRFL